MHYASVSQNNACVSHRWDALGFPSSPCLRSHCLAVGALASDCSHFDVIWMLVPKTKFNRAAWLRDRDFVHGQANPSLGWVMQPYVIIQRHASASFCLGVVFIRCNGTLNNRWLVFFYACLSLAHQIRSVYRRFGRGKCPKLLNR
jgi:hypothetical protein